MINFNVKYLYILFIIIIFFIYGLTLSEIIDYIFPCHDDERNDYHLAIEMIGEIGIAYLIYFSLKKYSDNIIETIFTKILNKPPNYLNQLLLLAFSFGIFKHLQKSNNKMLYFRKKFISF